MKAVMLTGATGFIGSHVAAMLLEKNRPVNLLLRRRTGLIDHYERLGAKVFVGNPGNLALIKESIRDTGTVIHCAGATKALKESDYFISNVKFTEKILSQLEPWQRIMYISSQAAAGPSGLSEPIDETSEPRPVSYYGKSKLAAENAVREWGTEMDGNYTILRPSIVYGPREQQVLHLFKSIKRGFMFVLGNGSKRFSIIYVTDLVRAIFSALNRDSKGKTYFVTNNTSCTWNEMGHIIKRALNKKHAIRIPVPENLAVPVALLSDALSHFMKRPSIINVQKLIEAKQPAWLCSNTRIKKDLAWEPEYSLEFGITKTAEWYAKENWI